MSSYLTAEPTEDDSANELLERATRAQEQIARDYERHTRAQEQIAANQAEAARNWRAERRERIATAALRGTLASVEGGVAPVAWAGSFACTAVAYADALIAELDKEPQP